MIRKVDKNTVLANALLAFVQNCSWTEVKEHITSCSGFTGLYERYGYTYLRDIVNYGGGVDHLFVKAF